MNYKIRMLKIYYPKLTCSWKIPNKLFPNMAAITKTKATIAKSTLTSLMSYGVLNKGFCSATAINFIINTRL